MHIHYVPGHLAAYVLIASSCAGPSPPYPALLIRMQIPIQLSREDAQALHAQVIEQVRDLILGGKLKPGAQIPSSRELAKHLNVSRNTVLLAYERLAVEGYIETRAGSKTYVSRELARRTPVAQRIHVPRAEIGEHAHRQPVLFQGQAPRLVHSGRKPMYDFFVGRPCPRAFPLKTWRRLTLARLTSAGSALTEYRHPAGLSELRQAIADHLGPARGIGVLPSQVVIVNGIQEALNIVARLFIGPGTAVAIENPCYQGALYTFQSYGANVIPVPVDENGINVAELSRHSATLAYVTPSHQFPTGVTLPMERRLRLLDWAKQVGAFIVEDDYDSDFRYDGPPLTALAGLDTSQLVIYLGTFSKSIGAGLRLGYLVLPIELVEAATTIKALLNAGHSWLDQAVMADFVASGAYARHLQQIRITYQRRRDCLVSSLRKHFGETRITGVSGGMHVMWHLPDQLPDAKQIEMSALAHGVGIYSLRSAVAYDFGFTPYSTRSLVVGYPALLEDQIREGVSRLAAALV